MRETKNNKKKFCVKNRIEERDINVNITQNKTFKSPSYSLKKGEEKRGEKNLQERGREREREREGEGKRERKRERWRELQEETNDDAVVELVLAFCPGTFAETDDDDDDEMVEDEVEMIEFTAGIGSGVGANTWEKSHFDGSEMTTLVGLS